MGASRRRWASFVFSAREPIVNKVDGAPTPEPIPPPPDIEPPVPDNRDSPAADEPEEKPAVKSKTIWASIIGIATTILSAVTDWRVLSVLVVAVLVFIILDRYFKLDIKGWFRS